MRWGQISSSASLARLGHPRRMIVSRDHRGGVLLQSELHDLAWMHARSVDRAAKQFLELDESMPLVQIQAAKHFVLEIAQAGRQEIAGRLGAREQRPGAHRFRELSPGELGGGLQLRVPRESQARSRAEARAIRGEELAQRSEFLEHLTREIQSRAALASGAEQDGEDLRVRQGRRAPREQLLARPLVDGPVSRCSLESRVMLGEPAVATRLISAVTAEIKAARAGAAGRIEPVLRRDPSCRSLLRRAACSRNPRPRRNRHAPPARSPSGRFDRRGSR